MKRFHHWLVVLVCHIAWGQNEIQVEKATFALPDFKAWVEGRIIYPVEALEANVSGTVHVEFVVSDSGTISEVIVLKGIGFGLNREIKRVILSSSGHWNPALFHGKPIASRQNWVIDCATDLKQKSTDLHSDVLFESSPLINEYLFPEVEPIPPQGRSIQEYLRKNIIYPSRAIEKGYRGKCFVTFLISTKGEVQDFHTLKCSDIFDEEAKRVITEMPKWTPGKVEGRPVPVRMSIPVVFDYEYSPAPDRVRISSYQSSGKQIRARYMTPAPLKSFDFQSYCDLVFNPEYYSDFRKEGKPAQVQFRVELYKGITNIEITNVTSRRVRSELKKIIQMSAESIWLPDSLINRSQMVTTVIDPLKMIGCANRWARKHSYVKTSRPVIYLGRNPIQFCKNQFSKPVSTTGNVIVSFVVDTNGKVQYPAIEQGIDSLVNREVCRIDCLTSGEWWPALDKKGKKQPSLHYLLVPLSKNQTKATPPENNLEGFINRNKRTPPQAQRVGAITRVGVKFRIEKNGQLFAIQITKPGCCGWNEELIRLLRLSSGFWTPSQGSSGEAVVSDEFLEFDF